MNTIIGPPATGDKFYVRKRLIEKLWKKIESGHHILMSAPRRIGKTSIMMYCLENPKAKYDVIYLITESVNNQNEFYRKLVKEVYNKLKASKKITTSLQSLFSSIKIKSIGPEGISLDDKAINYFDEFKHIAEQLELEEYKLVLS